MEVAAIHPARPEALGQPYDPGRVESRWYSFWEERGVFRPQPSGGEPFVVAIPPPNVTGSLTMGHLLGESVRDLVVRWRRMEGREVLYLPGMDHAGIATQNVVEKRLAEQGRSRLELGREGFLKEVWEWKEEYGGLILKQLRRVGISPDWTRERFTLDPAYSRAVLLAFQRLYEKGLVYRGRYIVNWCPRCQTALSDEEVDHQEVAGSLWFIRYPIKGTERFVTVATTRPETMLGDTAVAVHPKDRRHAGFVGKTAGLPIANVSIPIIADEAVDPAFGTGFVKVTPAHDANDFEIGTRHKLEMPLIMREDGTMGEEPGKGEQETGRVPTELRGLDRFAAREKIVQMLKSAGLLEKVEPHPYSPRRCYRCDTVVEPRLSDQWFVKMGALAEPVLAAYRTGQFKIVPERWRATFENWMEGIRDWNISRQLWWGHRIPVFTCTQCTHQWADRADPPRCPKCGGPVEQDPDVLDTWFSSWLWPFATLGWPERTPDLARFYPGHTLVTAPEILFFWVARMLMSGYHFMARTLPFTTVYLHGTVRDTQHRKMSKSLGNGIDPLDVVRLYGADALRWTLIAGSSLGADVILDPNDLETTFAPAATLRTRSGTSAASSWRSCQSGSSRSMRSMCRACRSRTAGSCRGCRRRSARPPRRSSSSDWTRERSGASSSPGRSWRTGTWRPSSLDWLRSPERRPPCAKKTRSRSGRSPHPRRCPRPCSRTASTRCCGCCIPSCRSSPKSCGKSCPAGPRTSCWWWRRGRRRAPPSRTPRRISSSRWCRKRSRRSGCCVPSTGCPRRHASRRRCSRRASGCVARWQESGRRSCGSLSCPSSPSTARTAAWARTRC